VVVRFIDGGNWSTRRKQPTCRKSLTLLYFFQLQNDPKFEEFLEAHLKGGKKQIWSNDVTDKVTTKITGDGKDSDADEGDKSDSGVEGNDKNTIDHYVNYVFLFLGETYCFHPVCHKGLSWS
jgi:hypothetical protein